jgi:hypothetical protein
MICATLIVKRFKKILDELGLLRRAEKCATNNKDIITYRHQNGGVMTIPVAVVQIVAGIGARHENAKHALGAGIYHRRDDAHSFRKK